MDATNLPRVSLREKEKTRLDIDDSDTETYADKDAVCWRLSPYIVMGYSVRMQMLMMFEQMDGEITQAGLFTAVDGDREAKFRELEWLLRHGVVTANRRGVYKANEENPITMEVENLFKSIRKELDTDRETQTSL